MREMWEYFKKLSTPVKVKFVVAFIPSAFLYGLYHMGKFAEGLSGDLVRWVYREGR